MELIRATFNVYLWTVVLTLVCGGLANLRIFRHRENIDVFLELYFSLGVAIIPVVNVFCGVSYLQIFFGHKDDIERMAMELDEINKKY